MRAARCSLGEGEAEGGAGNGNVQMVTQLCTDNKTSRGQRGARGRPSVTPAVSRLRAALLLMNGKLAALQ